MCWHFQTHLLQYYGNLQNKRGGGVRLRLPPSSQMSRPVCKYINIKIFLTTFSKISFNRNNFIPSLSVSLFLFSFAETYVKVRLVCGSEKIKTERTPSIKGTVNPVFAESLSYVIPAFFIERTVLVIQLMQKGHLRRDKLLGQVILGPYILTDTRNLSHFGQMLSGREAVRKWHSLYL